MQWFALTILVQASLLISGVFAAFGLTESGNIYTVDTDAGLVFKGIYLRSMKPSEWSYGVDFQLTKLMETSSQWSIMASRFGMMIVSSYYMAQYRFSIGSRSGRQAQSNRLWHRCILQLDPNRS